MYVCTYVRMYVCLHLCMYVCMYACMYVCVATMLCRAYNVCALMDACRHVCMGVVCSLHVFVFTCASPCMLVCLACTLCISNKSIQASTSWLSARHVFAFSLWLVLSWLPMFDSLSLYHGCTFESVHIAFSSLSSRLCLASVPLPGMVVLTYLSVSPFCALSPSLAPLLHVGRY